MSPSRNFLAFDLGAESGRAILGQLDGERLSLTETHRFPNIPVAVPAGVNRSVINWDVLRLWSEIKTGLARTIETESALSSIGLDTWGVDFGLLDRDGRLLANPVHYRDDRTDGMMEAAFQRMDREAIFLRTGIQFMQFNSLYQLLSLVIEDSPLLVAAETFLTIPDLFNYWLSGRRACEFTNATTTQCYNPLKQNWDDSILNAMQVPRKLFPEIVQPGTVLGELQPLVAAELGASAIPVVAPACHDTGSAVAAVPAVGGDFAWISSGTWSILGIEVPDAVVTSRALQFNLTNEGGVNGTFRLSKNVMGLWPLQECRRIWNQQGNSYNYAQLAQHAAEATPFRSIVDPDNDVFLKPGDMPQRIRDYCQRSNQPVPESHGAIVRCILESLALKYRLVLERLEQLTGSTFASIHIVGGGCQNELLNQFTADATGRIVYAGPVEATAMGNILVQAIAMGEVASLAEARSMLRATLELRIFEPNHHRRDEWNSACEKLRNLV